MCLDGTQCRQGSPDAPDATRYGPWVQGAQDAQDAESRLGESGRNTTVSDAGYLFADVAYEAELRRKKSLLPDKALYMKGRRGNQRRQESTGPATHSVSRVRGKSQRPNSFSGTCHGCGKKGPKKADCWQEHNITTPSGGGRKEGKMRQSLSHRGPDFGANNDRILLRNEQTAIATECKADTLRERGRETYSGEEVDRGYTVERVLGGVGVTNEIEWVVDSGCTNHMTGNCNALVKKTYVSLSAN